MPNLKIILKKTTHPPTPKPITGSQYHVCLSCIIVATLTLRELLLNETDVTEDKLGLSVYMYIYMCIEGKKSLLLLFKLLKLNFWQQLYHYIPTKRLAFY